MSSAEAVPDPSARLDRFCRALADRYGELGRRAGESLRRWLSGEMPLAYPDVLARHLDEEHLALVFDAFWQVLPFGTGGRRGRVGYGPNRMNPTTVAMTVQGHCEYLRRAFPNRSDLAVVVANDVRVFHDVAGVYGFLGADHPLIGQSSRSFGRLACEIYAGNGITAYYPRPEDPNAVLTTPELSFLISELGAVGGVNLSASHNPPDDNGVKVYDPYGSQPIAPADQELVEAMAEATTVRARPFAEALAVGLVRDVPAEAHQRYVDGYVKLYAGIHVPKADVPIVYTPLCGAGLGTVGDVLRALDFPVVVPPDEHPDGSFAPIPFKAPNPEVPQATLPARRCAEAHGATIVLSTDPDADRIGVEARLADGSWYHFDGNQIAAMLLYFLMLDPTGPRRRGLVIETMVTTKLLGRIVEEAEVESAGRSWLVDDLLVGFKYVADVLKQLEHGGVYRDGRGRDVRCRPDDLVLAGEESHGVMMIPRIRDKDAAPAAMYVAALHQKLAARGATLLDYYLAILERLGGYDSVARSIMMVGPEGMARKDRIMASLRESPPTALAGSPVRRVADYRDERTFGPFRSETDRAPRDVVTIETDACVVTVRPSGTEPKLKAYCQVVPGGVATDARGLDLLRAVRTRAEEIAGLVVNDLLARIDVRLSPAALRLSDIVDLERKREFDERTTPALREALASGRPATLGELLAWLRSASAGMTPGTDPLPALKAPIARLVDDWRAELERAPLYAALESWTRS